MTMRSCGAAALLVLAVAAGCDRSGPNEPKAVELTEPWTSWSFPQADVAVVTHSEATEVRLRYPMSDTEALALVYDDMLVNAGWQPIMGGLKNESGVYIRDGERVSLLATRMGGSSSVTLERQCVGETALADGSCK